METSRASAKLGMLVTNVLTALLAPLKTFRTIITIMTNMTTGTNNMTIVMAPNIPNGSNELKNCNIITSQRLLRVVAQIRI